MSQLTAILPLTASQVEEALGELASAGLVTSDTFDALRNLIGARRGRENLQRLGRRSPAVRRGAEGGRWSLLRGWGKPPEPAERVENWCKLLLRRYGVMFRDLLDREPAAPAWSELVRAYRRLEMRGDVRGGRFVAAVGGEQYALSEVIPALRHAEEEPDADSFALAGTDPLNLAGRVTDGIKVPALSGNRVTIRNGSMVSHRVRGEEPVGAEAGG